MLGVLSCACKRESMSVGGHQEVLGNRVISDTQNIREPQNSADKDGGIVGEGELESENLPGEEVTTWEIYPWEIRPGEVTMENLLVTALSPVGRTMYIWGGGWNEEDTGAGPDATTLGVSPLWADFAAKQTAEYDYHDYKYEIHNGLDCSGYIGWVLYNLFETENGQEGYVMKSGDMAENFADRGWGSYTPPEKVKDWQPGDIMSMKGHVWMSLGTCRDGSVLLVHSSVTGVFVAGISLPDQEDSQAVKLAENFMSTYYPEWYEKFPDCSRPYRYLEESGQFRWSSDVLTDQWKLKDMEPEDLLASLGQKFLAK